ncbi:MAG: substrate-binding domain-containing protein [Fervidobacterium sp.]|nr:substrate-binding domain-containing protein [Fervidobacterium sp.]
MKRLVLVLAVVLLAVYAFSFKVGLSLSTLNNPFFVTLRDGAMAAAKELGITLLVVDAQDKPAKQLNDIEDLIQKKLIS